MRRHVASHVASKKGGNEVDVEGGVIIRRRGKRRKRCWPLWPGHSLRWTIVNERCTKERVQMMAEAKKLTSRAE